MTCKATDLRDSLDYCFVSPNVPDRNGEPANLVDVGANLASAIWRIAELYAADLRSRGVVLDKR